MELRIAFSSFVTRTHNLPPDGLCSGAGGNACEAALADLEAELLDTFDGCDGGSDDGWQSL